MFLYSNGVLTNGKTNLINFQLYKDQIDEIWIKE
jgi:hypothetical protein